METKTSSKPISTSPPRVDLGNFLNATASAGTNASDLPELLNLLGKHLIEHANCIALFWVDLLHPQTPQMNIAAMVLESCPHGLQQWACTTATKAMAQGTSATDVSTSDPAQPLSMISVPLQPDANHVLAALFAGSEAQRFLPFVQLAADRISQWSVAADLTTQRQTSLDIAALQEISLAVADSKSTQQGCRKLANHLKAHLTGMSAQTELTIFIGKNALDKFPTLVGVSDCDAIPENAQLIEAVESAMAECISRNTETSWPPAGENFSLMCHKRLSSLCQRSTYLLLSVAR